MKIKKLPPSRLRQFLNPLYENPPSDVCQFSGGTYVVRQNSQHKYIFLTCNKDQVVIPSNVTIDKKFTPILLFSDFKKQVIAIRIKALTK